MDDEYRSATGQRNESVQAPDSYNTEMVEKILKAIDEPPVATFRTIEEYRKWQDGVEPDNPVCIDCSAEFIGPGFVYGEKQMTDSIMSAEDFANDLYKELINPILSPIDFIAMCIKARDKSVRNAALELAIDVVKGEFLCDNTGDPEDIGYSRGLADEIDAIRNLKTGKE